MQFSIDPPDPSLRDALTQHIDRMAKPLGALGRLEALALQVGLVQHSLQPAIRQPHVLVFAGDHGAVASGVTAYPQKLTWQLVERFLAGDAAISVACRQTALALSVVDAGVSHDFPPRPGLVAAKIDHGTANYVLDPAMWRSQLERAIARGRDLAHGLAAQGCNALGLGVMAVGASASAALLTHCLTDIELDAVTGRGARLDEVGRARKLAMLERALARGGRIADPFEALREYGGFEIVMLVGAMLGAAEKRMLIVVDGFVVTAALIAAHRIAPAVLSYCVFAGRSRETGHTRQLAHLGAEPLLDLGLALGEGTATALAFPLLRSAVAFVREMAISDSADVGSRRP